MEAEEIVVVPFSSLLMEIVDNRGKSCPFTTAGTPLIATNCIKNDNLFPTYETTKFVDTETYAQWFRGHPIPGDLIFVTKGSPGRVCIAPDPVDFCIAQDMVALRVNETKVYPRFIFALLRTRSVQEQIEQLHVGTMIPHFKKGDFDKLLLRIPSRKSQEFIGDFYFDLSFKIELNRQRNRTLEAMARALFQSWFVDFDPVKAKAAGKQPPGLKPEIAALFPDSFEETEVGVVPQGWQVAPIRDLCTNVENGGTPSRDVPDYWKPEQIPWLTSGEVRQNIVTSTQGFISRKGLENSSAKLWPPYTTVVALYGATAGCTTILASEVSANQACCGLLPVPHARFYVHQSLLKSIDFLRQQASGSAQQNLSQSIVGNLMILRPSEDVLSSFDKLTAGMYDKCIQSAHEIRLLSSLRDTLLPKLISGELRIPDAERIVARTI